MSQFLVKRAIYDNTVLRSFLLARLFIIAWWSAVPGLDFEICVATRQHFRLEKNTLSLACAFAAVDSAILWARDSSSLIF